MYLFLNINQFDALNFIISLFQASTCFEHMCSSSGGQKLYYTVSGIITPIGGRPVHRLREESSLNLCTGREGGYLVPKPVNLTLILLSFMSSHLHVTYVVVHLRESPNWSSSSFQIYDKNFRMYSSSLEIRLVSSFLH